MQSSPVNAAKFLSELHRHPAEQPEASLFWMFSPIFVFLVKIMMGQKIFL